MKTLLLEEAAEFLKMHPEELRRRAKLGQIPAAKPGKQWVFIQEDLVGYLRSIYPIQRQAPQSDRERNVHSWHFSDAVKSGGLTSP
jgi:excisionase family DNA binding protein